jgi:hypothetical protein
MTEPRMVTMFIIPDAVGAAVHSKELATARFRIVIASADEESMQPCPQGERERWARSGRGSPPWHIPAMPKEGGKARRTESSWQTVPGFIS